MSGDTFIGAPRATIDGEHRNLYAFTQGATDVTIKYLTIRDFGSRGQNADQGVVNHDSGTGWNISYNTIKDNAGAGVMLGSQDTLRYDCLLDNGQYGFNAYSPNGVDDLTIENNEIAGNDRDNWEQLVPGCGCSGGGKFTATRGAIVANNYVHGNHNVGLWADTNNSGIDFQDNYFSDNFAEGIIFEISYNGRIVDNTFTRNALGAGPKNPGFPTGAIYLSESGSDKRIPGNYRKAFDITGNVLIDNWSGVVLWENADRFCNSPANSSRGACTLVDPSVANKTTCVRGTIDLNPYYSDCRWKTQNVHVYDNTFILHPRALGAKCAPSHGCGLQGLLSNWGTYPSWSPYKGPVVEKAITTRQGNLWAKNTYVGPWEFMVRDQATIVSHKAWQRSWGQDKGSRFEHLGRGATSGGISRSR